MTFHILPLEVNATIAEHLPDQDIARFSRTCRATYNAVYHDRSSLWRKKFAQHYDLVPHMRNNSLKTCYQWRRKILRRNTRFNLGTSTSEEQCLKVIRDLLIDSFANGWTTRDANGDIVSKNLLALKELGLSTDLLHNVCNSKTLGSQNPLLTAVHILLSHLRFEKHFYGPAFGFSDSQKSMYATTDNAPIFTGKNKIDINLPWVLQAVNFFKQHFTCDESQEMSAAYDELPAYQKIKAWRRPLGNGVQSLGKTWKGAYAYLDEREIERLRRVDDDEGDDVFVDCFQDSEDQDRDFQILKLDFSGRKARWPKVFEEHLQSLSHPSASFLTKEQKSPSKMQTSRRATRAQYRTEVPVTASTEKSSQPETIDPKPMAFNLDFQGSGEDGDKFFAAGWLNPLPPQQGIPGWMRWTMMKFFADGEKSEGESDADDPFAMKGLPGSNPYDNMDPHALWAYEGVVLPGGEIVVGRWWRPLEVGEEDEDMYSGPFIFWCVD